MTRCRSFLYSIYSAHQLDDQPAEKTVLYVNVCVLFEYKTCATGLCFTERQITLLDML